MRIRYLKKAVLYPPAVAAILFTVPEAIQLIGDSGEQGSAYVPVVFELLLLLCGYLAALLLNLLVLIPLGLLLIARGFGLVAGVIWSCFLSLIVTTVAYAYEIFGYRDSILAPEYLYPIMIPVLVLGLGSFYLLWLQPVPASRPAPETDKETPAGEA